ncbi:tRNA lysidine(34) synthetase TilS [Halobacillus litoralis]|uniref:tRNA lysidine(34) synthetase TilS n=1 Tax=Halobacillus litoralis TaxID=45668 RepID=UPI001CD1CBE9|nr:tRNA lysidine(34) synthetase TilS [Halobacillus litoralis]MCA0972699.1 tRNA lysidine(34) synthetase TilS [Halobacillus litoralis]
MEEEISLLNIGVNRLMDQLVHSFIKKHQLIRPNETVIAAVSGGPDSMAMLHFLTKLRKEWSLTIMAVSVDHGLRGKESQEDLEYVKRMCQEWDVPCTGAHVDVKAYKDSEGLGTQEAARQLRYQVFEQQMNQWNADVLVTAHHGDDQIETIMMQMATSARPEAVKGIPVERPFAGGRLVRPFLAVSKDDIEHYVANHSIHPRLDPSNEETTYQRNAFRKRVVPFLKEQNPKVHQHMQAMSERMQENQSYISKQAESVLETVVFSSNDHKSARLSIETFKTFPLALQRTAFHLILNYLYISKTEDISYLHEEMFFDLLIESKPNAELHLPQGLTIVRAYDEVTFSFIKKEQPSINESLFIGETIDLPDGARLSAEWTENRVEGTYDFICDAHHVKLPLVVRTRRNGDRIRLRGMKGSKKVKDIFIDQKIPAAKRDTWPLVTDSQGKILWLVGLKKCGFPEGEGSGEVLRLHYENKAET